MLSPLDTMQVHDDWATEGAVWVSLSLCGRRGALSSRAADLMGTLSWAERVDAACASCSVSTHSNAAAMLHEGLSPPCLNQACYGQFSCMACLQLPVRSLGGLAQRRRSELGI